MAGDGFAADLNELENLGRKVLPSIGEHLMVTAPNEFDMHDIINRQQGSSGWVDISGAQLAYLNYIEKLSIRQAKVSAVANLTGEALVEIVSVYRLVDGQR